MQEAHPISCINHGCEGRNGGTFSLATAALTQSFYPAAGSVIACRVLASMCEYCHDHQVFPPAPRMQQLSRVGCGLPNVATALLVPTAVSLSPMSLRQLSAPCVIGFE